MPASFPFATPSRGRCSSARSRRLLAHGYKRDWLNASRGMVSGIALAVLVQLTSEADCARAADDTVTVPRGALEELILRDLSNRIHEMDSTSLSSFMQNLKSLSAPDPRPNPPSDPVATIAQAAAGSSPASEAVAGAAANRGAQPPAPAMTPPSTPLQQDSLSTSSTPPADAAAGGPKAPPEPAYSIFRDLEPATTSSKAADDLTAQLLGFRPSVDTSSPREDSVPKVSEGSGQSWTSVLGLPLAVWSKLDQVLPADLRAASGEPLTEEVKRAVYVVKGLILVASSALAYFLSRALLSQLARAVLGVPIVQQAARAAEAFTESAQQASPELQRRATAIMSSLPGSSTEAGGGAERPAAGRQADEAAAPSAARGTVPRAGPLEQARSAGASQRPRLEGRPGAGVGVQPLPPPLVPTAQGALYNLGQAQWERRSLQQLDPDEGASGSSPAGGDGDADVGAEVRRAPLGVGGSGVAQNVSGVRAGISEPQAAAGAGVLWRRGSGGRASQLSGRWDDAAGYTSEQPVESDDAGARPVSASDTDTGLGGQRPDGTSAASEVGAVNGVSDGEHRQDDAAAGVPKGLSNGLNSLDRAPMYDKAGLENVPLRSGSGKDPWF